MVCSGWWLVSIHLFNVFQQPVGEAHANAFSFRGRRPDCVGSSSGSLDSVAVVKAFHLVFRPSLNVYVQIMPLKKVLATGAAYKHREKGIIASFGTPLPRIPYGHKQGRLATALLFIEGGHHFIQPTHEKMHLGSQQRLSIVPRRSAQDQVGQQFGACRRSLGKPVMADTLGNEPGAIIQFPRLREYLRTLASIFVLEQQRVEVFRPVLARAEQRPSQFFDDPGKIWQIYGVVQRV
ncbi:MAG: hypothetical protein BWY09_01578 [Candidatus Hydrogenedentes bacterium ADurb.Bin179]|nr:MAG: hypothetical protein BWY09_01578 [Candidatus Hydrogenedentes bacterium ADurb.Bin179]